MSSGARPDESEKSEGFPINRDHPDFLITGGLVTCEQ